MLTVDPMKRPTAEQLLQDEFFTHGLSETITETMVPIESKALKGKKAADSGGWDSSEEKEDSIEGLEKGTEGDFEADNEDNSKTLEERIIAHHLPPQLLHASHQHQHHHQQHYIYVDHRD